MSNKDAIAITSRSHLDDLNTQLNDARQLIARQHERLILMGIELYGGSGWISNLDRMPAKSGMVYIANGDEVRDTPVFYEYARDTFYDPCYTRHPMPVQVTHWRPRFTAPTQKETP